MTCVPVLAKLLVLIACCSTQVADQQPGVVVFRAGTDGHHTYRIPSLVRCADGTLVAFAEGRRDNRGDPGNGHINLVCRLSHDGGKTWSNLQVIDQPPEGGAASNPTAVVDRRNGRVMVFYNRWAPGRGSGNSRVGEFDCTLWMRYSDDGGRHWSEPIDLTSAGRDVTAWHTAVFGPGSGIQLRSGRLIIPMYSRAARPDANGITRAAFVLYSDDGVHWSRGERVPRGCNESQVVETSDGRVLLDGRQERGPRRWLFESVDAGQTWDNARPGVAVTPVCTSIVRYPEAGPACLVWSGPRGPGRRDLVLRVSVDDGATFKGELLIGPGPAAYSNMDLLDSGALGVLWESGTQHPYEEIRFLRVAGPELIRLLESLQSGRREE